MICGVDGLQDRVRQRVFACSCLPHNTLNTILDQASHIGFVETQDRSIECDISAQNPTQDFLMLTIGDCLRKQAHQSIAPAGIVRLRVLSVQLFFLYTGWPVQFPQVRNSAVPTAPVQRFVCVHCTATGHLSSRGLFLHRSAVLCHRDICGSKPCFAADLGFKEIHFEARACNVMARAGGRLVRR